MKIVSYNIRFGLGLDQRYDLVRIADTVRDADIIGLQEVERNWKRSGMSDQPDILGGYLKEFYWVYCPAFDMDASGRNVDGTVFNRRRQFGPMLLSRWPIRVARLILLPKLGTVDRLNMDTGGIGVCYRRAFGSATGLFRPPLGRLDPGTAHTNRSIA
jgi:endonuclease/exonuclease/phosphatase family metal-dependent hydrolase